MREAQTTATRPRAVSAGTCFAMGTSPSNRSVAIGRPRGCPPFARIGPGARGRDLGQEGGGHLVGEVAEVTMDLHLQASEGRRVVSESVAPLLLQGIGLLIQLRGDVIQRGDDRTGLGLRADLHGRLERAGDRKGP